jgi:hypothetical protein
MRCDLVYRIFYPIYALALSWLLNDNGFLCNHFTGEKIIVQITPCFAIFCQTVLHLSSDLSPSNY